MELKMKHVRQLMELLNVKNVSELFFWVSDSLKTKKSLFKDLDADMQKALLTQKKYKQEEEVELNDHDQNKLWKFATICIQLAENISEDEADDKIITINELYDYVAKFQTQIIKLQTIVSPNETTTN